MIYNTRDSRFELETSAGLVVADYRMSGNTMTIFHSEVPSAAAWARHRRAAGTGGLKKSQATGREDCTEVLVRA